MNRIEWLEKRKADITSTQSSALFGLCPYFKKLDLWLEKAKGIDIQFRENERTELGLILEPAIAQAIAVEIGGNLSKMDEYLRIPELRIGSSFDYKLDNSILEIKKVDEYQFKKKWNTLENIIPEYIEIQVQHQMLVSGLKSCIIGVLVGGNRLEIFNRQADVKIHKLITDECADFWLNVDNGIAPEIEIETEYKAVARWLSKCGDGVLETQSLEMLSLVEQYQQASAEEKEAERKKDVIKAKLLILIGDHKKVIHPEFSISCGEVKGSEGVVITANMVGNKLPGRSGYRAFRVNKKG